MSRWTPEEFHRLWKSYVDDTDPDDPKERKRQRLIRAATELFIRQGYRKTSMDEVARAAGVAKGTLYLYFKNKGELLLHGIIEEKRRHSAAIMPLFRPELSPQERLREWLRVGLVLTTEMPLVARLLGRDQEILSALADLPPEITRRNESDRMDLIGQLVSEAAAPHHLTPEELAELTQVFTGMMYLGGLINEPHVRQRLSGARFAELFAGLLVDGLTKKGDPS